eukprot:6213034-Pleurochrysis_carterae.AAC.2
MIAVRERLHVPALGACVSFAGLCAFSVASCVNREEMRSCCGRSRRGKRVVSARMREQPFQSVRANSCARLRVDLVRTRTPLSHASGSGVHKRSTRL